jgi:transcriptional regulator with XRE-family HTH domain
VDLSELIERRRAGRSYQRLADASGLTKQAWQPYVKTEGRYGSRRVPEPQTILGMARALDVDVETIMLAIGETIGVLPRDRKRPALLDALPPHETLELLEEEDVATIVRFIHLLAGLRADAAARAAAAVPAPAARRASRAAAPRVARARESADASVDAESHTPTLAAVAAVS